MSAMLEKLVDSARLAALSALALVLLGGFASAQRVALVVGNAGYAGISYPLANPVNDATALDKKLSKLGFEVTLLTDTASADFWPQLTRFSESAQKAETVLFFFAGHAFQMDGINYLVPNDAELRTKEAIRTETWDLDAIIARLNAPGRQTLVFLDACRNNPLPESIQKENQGRRGLARLQTGRGTFVAFATEPNNVTYDGDEEGGNSPFTRAILDNIDIPGISISDMMIKVRNQVQNETFERQTPWDQSSLNAQFYFKEHERKKENGFGVAELELLAALPEDQRAAFLALLKENGIKTNFTEEDIVETIVIKRAVEEPKGPSILIAGLNPTEAETLVPDRTVPIESERVAGSQGESASGVEVASIDPSLIGGTSVPTVELERTGPSQVVGETEAVEVRPGVIVPPMTRVRGGVFQTSELFARSGTPVASQDTISSALWLVGSEIDPVSDEGLRILEEVYQGAVEIRDGEVVAVDPKELKIAVQGELARLGCYRLRVDGDWGRGSRTAAARYFAGKLLVPDSLEPTPEFLRQLQTEESVICQNSVAKDRRVAERFEEVAVEAPKRTLKGATKEQQQETKKKISLTPGVFR